MRPVLCTGLTFLLIGVDSIDWLHVPSSRKIRSRTACAVKESETDKILKNKLHTLLSFRHFCTISAIVFRSQSHDFDGITHAGAPLGVEQLGV